MRMYALTGGIGSGKSTVARLLGELGCPVLSADAIARSVVEPGRPALAAIRTQFGDSVLTADGQLDRRSMATLVFEDDEARARLEAIMHPAIAAAFAEERDRLGALGHRAAVYEIPLLFETGRQAEFDAVIAVLADDSRRIERVIARDASERAGVRARIATQVDDARRRRDADVVIQNDGTIEDLRERVREVAHELQLTPA